MQTDPLKGKIVTLKEIDFQDIELIRYWRNNWFIRSETREYRLITREKQESWWKSLQDDSNTLMFTIWADERMIGVCGLTYIDWRNGHTELSCYIGHKKDRRKGYYSDSLKSLTRYAFEELHLHMVYGEIYAWNEGALKACKKLGFLIEGPLRDRIFRFGKWHGSYFISKTEKEWDKEGVK